MKKVLSIAFIFVLSLGLILVRPFDIYASTTGSQIGFTNNSSYTGNIKIYRTNIEPISNYGGTTYQYAYYVQVDPGLYGYVQGNFNNSNSELWSVAVSDGISEFFYSNQINLYVTFVSLSQDSSVIPQSLLDDVSSIDDRLAVIEQIRQYNVPLESFPLIYTYFMSGYETFETLDYRYTTYPLFKFSKTSQPLLLRTQAYTNNTEFSFIFFSNINLADSVNSFTTYFNVENCSVVKMERLSNYQSSNQVFNLCKVTLKAIGDYSNKKVYYNGTFWNDVLFAPVVIDDPLHSNYSTDFALIFGLSNDLLNDLHIIANGTQQSNNSSSNLEDMNDDYDDVSQQVFGLENNFSTGFDSSMQNVPTTFNFGTQFGNKFLATATWVRNQFDTMTTNTPFGALITFSLVLGLALLIVGRRLL